MKTLNDIVGNSLWDSEKSAVWKVVGATVCISVSNYVWDSVVMSVIKTVRNSAVNSVPNKVKELSK